MRYKQDKEENERQISIDRMRTILSYYSDRTLGAELMNSFNTVLFFYISIPLRIINILIYSYWCWFLYFNACNTSQFSYAQMGEKR